MTDTFDTEALFRAIDQRVNAGGENAIRDTLLRWAVEYDATYGAAEMADVLANVQRTLETTDCAGCHAPGGLIYNGDLAEKARLWWREIDEALDDYRDSTGEKFAPDSLGQLVWFAVEWNAHEIASVIESEREAILADAAGPA